MTRAENWNAISEKVIQVGAHLINQKVENKWNRSWIEDAQLKWGDILESFRMDSCAFCSIKLRICLGNVICFRWINLQVVSKESTVMYAVQQLSVICRLRSFAMVTVTIFCSTVLWCLQSPQPRYGDKHLGECIVGRMHIIPVQILLKLSWVCIYHCTRYICCYCLEDFQHIYNCTGIGWCSP